MSNRLNASILSLVLGLPLLMACTRPPPQAGPPDDTAIETTVPAIPRFPLGLPARDISEWELLDPACRGTRLQDIRPCMQSFVDHGSVLGLVTLVDNGDLGVQLDAVGQYKSNLQVLLKLKFPVEISTGLSRKSARKLMKLPIRLFCISHQAVICRGKATVRL